MKVVLGLIYYAALFAACWFLLSWASPGAQTCHRDGALATIDCQP